MDVSNAHLRKWLPPRKRWVSSRIRGFENRVVVWPATSQDSHSEFEPVLTVCVCTGQTRNGMRLGKPLDQSFSPCSWPLPSYNATINDLRWVHTHSSLCNLKLIQEWMNFTFFKHNLYNFRAKNSKISLKTMRYDWKLRFSTKSWIWISLWVFLTSTSD